MLGRDPVLNLLPFGVVIATARGEVVLINAFARELLSDGKILSTKDGILAAKSKAYRKALSEAIDLASRRKDPRSAGFSMVRQGLPPISVFVVPVNRRNGASDQGGLGEVVVFVSDPLYHVTADPTVIAEIFNFTPSEGLVAKHLLKGQDVYEIAQELHLSRNTVRNHLKRLYSKTNTHKHCELLHLLLRSPAALRLQPKSDVAKRKAAINARKQTSRGPHGEVILSLT
ncbi:MAG: LuxR C-terminal-related transcriptional regulator [Bryobacteraceae bacterium]|jgi:DNA-binding CsgD family transcriptional regulator